MRKFYLMLLANIMGYVVANAIPANPTPAKVLQPDGSYLTVSLFGDEFMHYTTTQDGYTVVKSPSGYYIPEFGISNSHFSCYARFPIGAYYICPPNNMDGKM